MNQEEHSNPWKTLESSVAYENPWIEVRHERVVRPDGQQGIYGVVSMKNRAVGVVPLHDDGTVTLVGQWRYTMDCYSWEIPEGGCPEGESPLECAGRELHEETGLVATALEPLGGEIHLSNSVSDERGSLFVATGLSQEQASPEATERIAVLRLPLADAVAMALDGRINDGLSVLALVLLERKLAR
jgi:8-oxo-dGTP pyrophosphatase MutT (NUDIX family)